MDGVGMPEKSEEITILVSRKVKPGHEEDYAYWLQRVVTAIRKYPGYRGITMIASPGSVRYVIYRFEDEETLKVWHDSVERRQLIDEVEEHVTQQFESASGLESWFVLPNLHAVVAPPRWKMLPVTLFAVFLVSYLARLAFTPLTQGWPLYASVALYSLIIVAALTYFLMPTLSWLLRRWLYPNSERRL
jgi:antibiotic biosynthesis monooxygenase (ABM) superfamily enzyme